jgi:predicted Zn-dependent protease
MGVLRLARRVPKAWVAAGLFLAWRLLRRDRRQRVPFTGRKHVVLVPEAVERALGETTFARLLASKRRVPESDPRARRVAALGAAIVRAAAAGDGAGGYVDHLRDAAWRFVVLDDPAVNACALPGGKVCVNAGLIDRFAGDDAALAFVVAHEVGHVVARHSAEQLTMQAATQLVATVAQGLALAAGGPAPTKQGAQGVETLLEMGLFRPRSREQEYEADAIGVELVRAAGLGDGSASIAVFQCFDALADAAGAAGAMTKQLSFLSTHPSPAERAHAVRERLSLGGGRAVAAAAGALRGGRGGAHAPQRAPAAAPPPQARSKAEQMKVEAMGGY